MTTIQTQSTNERVAVQAVMRTGVRRSPAPIGSLLLQPRAQTASERAPNLDLPVDQPLWLAGALRGALLFQASLAIVGLLGYELWSLAAW